jgi:hypothetical protein
MKISLMSILVDSNLKYEFPYQIGTLFYERFNQNFEKEIVIRNQNYKDWMLSLNLSHSNKIKDVVIKGPDIDKRNMIITYSIFNGIISSNMESKFITIAFISNMLNNLNHIFDELKIKTIPNSLELFCESFLIDLNNNYEKYMRDYEED